MAAPIEEGTYSNCYYHPLLSHSHHHHLYLCHSASYCKSQYFLSHKYMCSLLYSHTFLRLHELFVSKFVHLFWLLRAKRIKSVSLFFFSLQSKFFAYNSTNLTITIPAKHQIPTKRIIEFPLNCSIGNQTQTCPTNYPKTFNPNNDLDPSSIPVCPDYFRWIHEDLRPWKDKGITRDMVEKAKSSAHFRPSNS